MDDIWMDDKGEQMKQYKVPYAYLGKTPEAGTADIEAPSSKDAARIVAMLRPSAVIGEPWVEENGPLTKVIKLTIWSDELSLDQLHREIEQVLSSAGLPWEITDAFQENLDAPEIE